MFHGPRYRVWSASDPPDPPLIRPWSASDPPLIRPWSAPDPPDPPLIRLWSASDPPLMADQWRINGGSMADQLRINCAIDPQLIRMFKFFKNLKKKKCFGTLRLLGSTFGLWLGRMPQWGPTGSWNRQIASSAGSSEALGRPWNHT